MIKKLIVVIYLLCRSYQTFSQDIISDYTNYFENTREIPHLHLNQTSFLKGEEVWFQAYVLEQNSGKPYPTKSNFKNGIDVKFTLNKPLRKKQKFLLFSNKDNIIAK